MSRTCTGTTELFEVLPRSSLALALAADVLPEVEIQSPAGVTVTPDLDGLVR